MREKNYILLINKYINMFLREFLLLYEDYVQ